MVYVGIACLMIDCRFCRIREALLLDKLFYHTTSESSQKHLFTEHTAARKRVTPLHISCALFSGTAALRLQAVLAIGGVPFQNCAFRMFVRV